tara:strand:- start:326 stop:457 length:132 start_codon:yes stop_codon:yes gene_type:complete
MTPLNHRENDKGTPKYLQFQINNKLYFFKTSYKDSVLKANLSQ